jgi:UPF0176 protein
MLKVIAFYKYTDIEHPDKFRIKHLAFCKALGIKGRILVATEGINGSVSGTAEQIDAYKQHMFSDPQFNGIEFKEDTCLMHPFNKMIIKIKPELVRFEQSVSYKNAGQHLSPKQFLDMSQQDNVLLLDARNNYESRVGKFKNAIAPEISTFREFPKVVKELEEHKDKKILMYCTGGIRCEKASAFLIQNGFQNVYQLHGGILSFAKQYPDTIWEGKCFVFDKRLLSDVNTQQTAITSCELCNVDCDLYKRCRNLECDKLSVICLSCERSFGGCCSKECFASLKPLELKK